MRKLLLLVASFVLVGMMAPWSHSHGLVSADMARVAASLAAYSSSSPENPVAARSAAFVEANVLDALASGQRPDVLVRFAGRADLSAANLMRDKQARGEFTVNALTTHADAAQHGARQTLQAFGRQPAALEDVNGYQVLWLVNAIAVKAISQTELEALASDPNVVGIEQQVLLPPLELDQEADEGSRAPASHIAHINAPAAWDLGHTGEGIVVSGTDSGVRHTHAALVNQYRGNLGGGTFNHNYNWFDPYNFSAAPRNSGDHGTHTMGTSVGDDGGDNQIGVAPDASWIACIGFGGAGGGASSAGLIACGQFALAPTDTNGDNPDPSRAAHVVNNSWGGTVCNGVVDPWYEGVIDGWIAAGIVPVFSMGNASNCQFPNNPPVGLNSSSANLAKSFSIGSSGTNNSQVAPHTIKGPTRNIHPGTSDLPSHFGFPTMKPNVVAPGVGIRSSVASGDANYGNSNGTSMSAPAVAGLVALMWDAADCLIGDYATTGNLITTTARPIPVATGSNADGIDNVPNVATGWGEIDALAAVEAAIAHCDAPAVTGPKVRATRVINLEVETGQSTTADLLIENTGIGSLTWSATEAPATCASTADVAWLSLGNTSGSVAADDAQNVVVTANAASLAAGVQGARLCLTSNDSDNALVEIRVNLVVRPAGFVAPFPAPYCAVHAAATPTVPVSRVLFAGIDNASSPASGAPVHEDFTAQIAQVEAGQVLPFRVELNTLGGNNFGVGVYVDWNNDGDLGIEELTVLGFLSGSTGTDGQNITANLTIPADAASGDYRMRVLSRFAGAGNAQPINSCGTVNGQGEDYTLRVIGGGGGTDPLIAVDPDSIAFNLAVGASGSESLTIGNFGGGTLNWDLLDPGALANARGTALINENFEGSFPPAGWTTVDNSAAADCPWLRSDEYPLPLLDPALSRGAAIDSDDCGVSGMPANSIDTSLIAPTLDLSDATEASLSFDLAYRHWAPQRLDVDVSINGGTSWTTVHSTTTGPNSGTISTTPQTVDLSDFAGEGAVSIRWRFNSGWSWWAFVDNVVVTADAGGEPPGNCWTPGSTPWLSATPTSGAVAGAGSQVVAVAANATGLAEGSYDTTLCVSSNDSAGSTLVEVPVTLTVTAGGGSDPVIAVTPTALAFSVDSGDSDSDDLSIGNVGGGTLTWNIDTTGTTRTKVDLSRLAQPATMARSATSGARSAAAVPARAAEKRVRDIALRGGDPVSVLVVSPDGEINEPPDFPAPPQNLIDDLNAFPDTTATLYTGALASVTAAAFQAYDVVIVSNNGRWSAVGGQTSVGNALADYVDGGGKVVVFNFAYDFFGWELGGRFITQNYGPFQQATGDSTAAASMVIVQAGHPIFDGAKSVTQPDGFFRLDTALTSGSQVLANWSDGLPFIAANDNSVAFNILYGANPSWSGDLDILVHNAVVHLAGDGGTQPGACGAPSTVSWLNVGTASGSTAAGATSTSTITVDASGLAAGSYEAALCVASNDPVNPQVEVPVTLTVTGDPPITDRIFCDGFEEGGDGTCGSGPGPGQDIVVIDGIDFTPNADGTGGSIVWGDGSTCQCDGFEPGDPGNLNFNIYNAGVPFFYWPTGGGTPRGAVTLDGGSTYAVLASGAVIGPASTYMSPGGSATFTAPWHTPGNVNGYLGFQFLHGGITKYGYARISTGPNGRPLVIHSVSYNDAGDPITIP